MKCKRFEKMLPRYLHGELLEKEYHALQEHLERCEHCRSELESLRSTFNIAERVMRTVPAPDKLTGKRALVYHRVDLHQGSMERVLRTPQFRAILATAALAIILFWLSGTTVVYRAEPLNYVEYCAEFVAPPPPSSDGIYDYDLYAGNDVLIEHRAIVLGYDDSVQRPRMQLRKPKVETEGVKSRSDSSDSPLVAQNEPVSQRQLANRESGWVDGGMGGGGMGGGGMGGGGMGGFGGRAVSSGTEESRLGLGISAGTPVIVQPQGGESAQELYAKGEALAYAGELDKAEIYNQSAYEMDPYNGKANDEIASVTDRKLSEAKERASGAELEEVIEEVCRARIRSSESSTFIANGATSLAMDGTAGSIAERDGKLAEFGYQDSATIVGSDRGRPSIDAAVPRPREPAGYNPYVMAAENAFSTFSIDVDTASYGLARQQLYSGALPDTEAVRTEEFINSFDYDYRPPSGDQTFAVHTEMAPSPFRPGMELLKIGVKGRRIGRDDHRRAILTLVIDTSGSMATPERLGLVKQSLKLLLDQLNPEDEIAIVQFGGDARLVREHTAAGNKDAILESIDSLQAGGPTLFDKGLALGYQLATSGFSAGDSNRIIILSDGVANLGELDPEKMLRQVGEYRQKGIYLSVLGFGAGSYDDALLEGLANRGDGTYAYVDTIDEARHLFVDQLAATLHVIASDVKIQVEFNPDRVLRYRQIGYENRQLTKEQFRDDTVDAGEVGSGQSVTALYDVELKPGGEGSGPIATVFVRYRRADNFLVEEISSRVADANRVAHFEEASPRYQLAACVAEFAEHLRRSPYTESTELIEVVDRLRPAALSLDLDGAVQELLRLIMVAEGLEN